MWSAVATLLFLVACTDGQTTNAPTCFNNLGQNYLVDPSWISSSSETISGPESTLLYAGWCANNTNDPWVEITFPNSYGIKGLMVGPKPNEGTSFPRQVNVQYIPHGGNRMQEFPFPGGKLEINATTATDSTVTFNQAIAVDTLRFTIRAYESEPCMKLELFGCPLSDVCPGGCQNNGVCMAENHCQCPAGFYGNSCEVKDCVPGDIKVKSLDASSEDPNYPKAEVINDNAGADIEGPNRGWCPLETDTNPWIEFTLEKPLSVSVFDFAMAKRSDGQDRMYMMEFDLQYVSPVDSSNTYRTYANNIPSINSTHYFSVTLVPALSTQVVLIKPTKVEKRACFKVQILGCDPKQMCSTNYCMNNGSCIGPNICKCANGYFGQRCEESKTDIKTTSVSFVNITKNILITTSISFHITGHVTLQTVGTVQAVSLTGSNNYITVDPTSVNVPCLSNIDSCTNGFTFALDLNFASLLDNTYLISSGGNLANHKGIALFYVKNTLVFVVSTSTQMWQLTVPYNPVLNTWQHFEITWNKNLGVELHVNGHVLGSATRPDNRPATDTVNICLGCSHTSISTILNVLIKEVHAWTIDRTDLVNAGIASTPQTTSTTKAATAVQTAAPTTAAPTTDKTTAPGTSANTSQPNPVVASTNNIPQSTTASASNIPSHATSSPASATTGPAQSTLAPAASTSNPSQAASTSSNPAQSTSSVQPTTTQKPKDCNGHALGLAQGNISVSALDFSSQDNAYPASQIGNDGYNATNSGWCPSPNDSNPFIEIQLPQPMAISSLSFNFPTLQQGDNSMYMTSFQLQYVSPQDKQPIYRTYANHIPSMNSSHYFDVDIPSDLVTKVILIKPEKFVGRPCFKLEIFGCSPTGLCVDKFCQNGGTCNGPNTCACPDGFYGDNCQQTKNHISTTNVSFVNITNNVVISSTINFHITGHVTLQTVNHTQAVYLNGSNSFITVKPSTVHVPCLLNIDKCTNGFTFGLDLNFVHLVNNTYIVSSGGNLDNHKGIALYYIDNNLVFVVSTSTQIWHLTVPYKPVLNTWQHFEITWNKHLGVEIHVNGHLLGTAARPDNRPASQTVNICLGCSHTNLSVILNVLIKEIFSWNINRVDLINAGLVTTQKPMSTTTSKPQPTGPAGSDTTTAAGQTAAPGTGRTTTVATQPSTPKPKDCKAQALGIVDGRIPLSSIDASSQDKNYTMAQLGNDGYKGNNSGWCPLTSDHNPWIEIQLPQPMAISSLSFNFPTLEQGDKSMYMTSFQLQYVSPQDKQPIYRTYANHIPSLNGTHFMEVTLPSPVVAKVVLIKPETSVIRPCFKLELMGCAPQGLCADNFCQNGGTCNGPNTCACPDGFYGDSCQETKNHISTTNVSFVNITNNVVISSTINFNITGHVTLQTVNHTQAVYINGSNSFITVNPSTVHVPCLLNIDKCTNGFTFGLDLNFVHLVNNTYIVSSGGNLDHHKGIALYYVHNTLVFVVSTSTQIWHLTVPYKPVLNTWQHFEITWNKHLGVEIHVNGHLLGTAARPDNRPASQTVNICLGCSHTNLSVILNVLIKEIFSWNINRVDLINSGLVTTQQPMSTTTSKPWPTGPAGSGTTTTAGQTAAPGTGPTTTVATQPSTPKPKVCTAQALGIVDGRIPLSSIDVSSQDQQYTTSQLGNDGYNGNNSGWCPLASDNNPWIEVQLPKPMAISSLSFNFPTLQQGDKSMYMTSFQLQYVSPQDKQPIYRTYANHIPSLNSSHYLEITLPSPLVAKVVLIKPETSVIRPCFKLELMGCAPQGLCADNFCQNGGTCNGPNTCACPNGFYGDSCQETKNHISTTNVSFVNITNNVVISSTINFNITGHVTLQTVNHTQAVFLNGSNSFITVNPSTVHVPCLLNIDKCTNGFTFGLDLNFVHLVNNTYIVSSGGNLVNHKGIALYYVDNKLVFVVSTSTQIWHLTVPYKPVLNTWQHFEITWNKHLGVEIHVNGHLLGTASRPDNRPASQTVNICLGCSHTNLSVILNVLIKEIISWNINRVDLINAGIVTTQQPMSTTTSKPQPTGPAGSGTTTTAGQTAAPSTGTTLPPTTPPTTPKPKDCIAHALGILDGRIPVYSIDASSQDQHYPMAQLGNDGYNGNNSGWCPLASDNNPWIEIQLPKPMAISSLSFNFPTLYQGDKSMYMTSFQLQYISPQDKQPIYRTYASHIRSLNSTHYLEVTLPSPLVAKVVLIKPETSVIRPCFKLELMGCGPQDLCADNFCQNGGSCHGSNICSCPAGYYGDRCQETKTNITTTDVSFVNITNNVVISSTIHFNISGHVSLQTVNQTQAVYINGSNSFITVNPSTLHVPCLMDIDKCTNGFTFALDLNFVHLANNTYIISSGGNLDNHKGIAFYYVHNTLVFVVSTSTKIWHLTVPYKPVLNTWQHFEITWNKHLGVEIHVNGHLLGTASRPDNRPASQTVNICLGCSHTNLSVILNVLIKEIVSWNINRVDLINAGLVNTTTITSFTWDLTKVVQGNIIIGNEFNLTVNGGSQVSNGGLTINSSQFIDFGNSSHLQCLLFPSSCSQGLTIQFKIQFKRIEENTYLLTSGGQTPDGVGVAVIYRYGKIQFIVSTSNQSWYVTCGRNEIKPNRFQTVMISWHVSIGLEVFVDNVLIEGNKNPAPHVPSGNHVTSVVIGKQTSTSVKVDFVLSVVSFWYAQVDILVTNGICKPPVRPTVSPSTTVAPTTQPAPHTTPVTSLTTLMTSAPGQCPVGCVSVASTQSPPTAAPATNAPTTAAPNTAAPTTAAPTTAAPTTAAPTTTLPTTTTERGAPNYHVKPIINVIIGKDNNSYLPCSFQGASEANVVLVVRLLVAGKVELTQNVAGNTGIAMFSVIQLNMNLYMKEIKCSVTAHFVGSTISTPTYTSNPFKPHFIVTPGHVIVIEGHRTEFVTVTSTAPPQLYCCDGCKGQCQIHIVGSFHYNRLDKKCDQNKVIAQAIIESHIPPHYNKPICGFALTMANWNQQNKIGIKATLDLRRDGDHGNRLELTAHVYNQQVNTQITTTANSFQITAHPIEVTIKDNHHTPDTCKSVNDPHMMTFDGKHYNNMHEGEFILFRHKTLPFEVRSFYYKCSRRSHATCNCAVAVKSGDDVITVNGCHGTTGGHPGQGHGVGLILQQLFGHHGHGHEGELAKTPMTIQIYKNGDLTPGTFVRRFGCGQKYEIQLPTGMIVTVAQSYKPFINIWIKASSYDRGHVEGLCGNFDGSRNNDFGNENHFINQWKAPQSYFFQGVGASSQNFWSTYCSCVQGRTQICAAGLGYIPCSNGRNDVTSSLLRQAQRPILTSTTNSKKPNTRHRRSVDEDEEDVVSVYLDTNIPEDDEQMTIDEAREQCREEILNSTVTQTCQPILTTNLTDQIENCAVDYNATGSFEWAKDAIRDIVVDCVDSANRILAANNTGDNTTTPDIDVPSVEELDNILKGACVEDCGDHGSCSEGVCACDMGYTGEFCNISSTTVPTITNVPVLCDVSQTSDCGAALVYGINIVESDSLTCHYSFIELADVHNTTGVTGTIKATFLSQNKALCPLPKVQSSVIRLSNDGIKPSNESMTHVVYNSVCHTCTIYNVTVTEYDQRCVRQDSTCIIDGACFAANDQKPGNPCRVCYPDDTESAWSDSTEPSCTASPVVQEQTDGMERTQIIILAVVCAVFAVIIIFGTFYICRAKKSGSKTEFGEYEVNRQSAIILPRENLGFNMEKL